MSINITIVCDDYTKNPEYKTCNSNSILITYRKSNVLINTCCNSSIFQNNFLRLCPNTRKISYLVITFLHPRYWLALKNLFNFLEIENVIIPKGKTYYEIKSVNAIEFLCKNHKINFIELNEDYVIEIEDDLKIIVEVFRILNFQEIQLLASFRNRNFLIKTPGLVYDFIRLVNELLNKSISLVLLGIAIPKVNPYLVSDLESLFRRFRGVKFYLIHGTGVELRKYLSERFSNVYVGYVGLKLNL